MYAIYIYSTVCDVTTTFEDYQICTNMLSQFPKLIVDLYHQIYNSTKQNVKVTYLLQKMVHECDSSYVFFLLRFMQIQ